MKVLALNSSPNMGRGNTALIMTPFLTGLQEAGAEVEVIYTRQLKINPCLSDFSCWLKRPGECFQDDDDMADVYPKLREAAVWVLATPLYVDGMAGPLKNLLDRLMPLLEPFVELRDGHCCHPLRKGLRPASVVLVASCGHWETDNFDLLLAHVRTACRNIGQHFAGALLRPHARALRWAPTLGQSVDDVYAAATEAGRQLVQKGEMSAQTLAAVGREVMPLDEYVHLFNQRTRQAMAAASKG